MTLPLHELMNIFQRREYHRIPATFEMTFDSFELSPREYYERLGENFQEAASTFTTQTNLDYFLSKRRGLQGREPSTEFCEEHAVEWIQHVFDHGHLHGTAALQSFLEFGDWRQHVASGPQWEHHLHRFIEETGDFDGDDFRILSRAPTSHDRRAVSHWLGLRLAHAKLSKQPLHYENGTFTSK